MIVVRQFWSNRNTWTLRIVIRVKDLQSIDVFLDFMYLISYICQMKATDKKDSGIRELYFSDEFTEFYEKLQDKVKAKFEHTMDIIRTEYVLNT